MAVELPEPLQWVLLLLAGTRWPEADEGQLREMADHWRKAATALEDAGHAADAAMKRALEGQQGAAAEALTKHWAQYTTGKGTQDDPGFFPGLVQGCNGMGDMLEAMANSAETAKIQIIAQLGILAFDIATAEAEAPVTFGASMAQIPIVVGLTREAVGEILKKLLAEALEHAVKQAVQMGAINLMAQSIEVLQGHRKSIDGKELGQSALGGAVAGATGHLLGKGVGAAGSKAGLGHAMETLPGKLATGAAVGVGTDVTTQAITTGHVDSGSLLGSGLSGAGGVGAHAGAAAAREHFNGPKVSAPHEGQLPTFSGTPHADSPSNTYRGPGGSGGSGQGLSSGGAADRPSLAPFTPHDSATSAPGRGLSGPSVTPHLDSTPSSSHTDAPSSSPAPAEGRPSAAAEPFPGPVASEPHPSASAGSSSPHPATAEAHPAPEQTRAPAESFTPRPTSTDSHLAPEHTGASSGQHESQPTTSASDHGTRSAEPFKLGPVASEPRPSASADSSIPHPATAEAHPAPEQTRAPAESFTPRPTGTDSHLAPEHTGASSGQHESQPTTPVSDHGTPSVDPSTSRPAAPEPHLSASADSSGPHPATAEAHPAPEQTRAPAESFTPHSGAAEPHPAPEHTGGPAEPVLSRPATPGPEHSTTTPVEQPVASHAQQPEPQLTTAAPEHSAPAPAADLPHGSGVPSGLGGASVPSFRPEHASSGASSRPESTVPNARPGAAPEIHLDDAATTAELGSHTPTAQPEGTPTATPVADPTTQAAQSGQSGGIPAAPPLPAFAAPGGGGAHSSPSSHVSPPPPAPSSGSHTNRPSHSATPTSGGSGIGQSPRGGRPDATFEPEQNRRQAELDQLRQQGGRSVRATIGDLGKQQGLRAARPDNHEDLVRDLPGKSEADRLHEIDSLSPENRRWLARNPAVVDNLRATLPPREFARTAAHLLVNVDERVTAAPSARAEARAQVERLLQDPDTTARLLKNGASVEVVPRDVSMTDVAGYHNLKGKQTDTTAGGGRTWDDVRGSGGRHAAVTEENLTGDHTTVGGDGHYHDGYSTTTHEFAHTLHKFGLTDAEKKTITDSYQAKFNDPNAVWPDGTHPDNYSRSDENEYFAQATNAWLGTNHGEDKTHQTRNNGPDWVRQHEPALVPLLEKLYGADPASIHSEPANQVRANTGQYEDFRNFWEGVDEQHPNAGEGTPSGAHLPAPDSDTASIHSDLSDPFADSHEVSSIHSDEHDDAHSDTASVHSDLSDPFADPHSPTSSIHSAGSDPFADPHDPHDQPSPPPPSHTGPRSEAQPGHEPNERREKLSEDVDSTLDEVDHVLEANSEDFVRSYVQKGGDGHPEVDPQHADNPQAHSGTEGAHAAPPAPPAPPVGHGGGRPDDHQPSPPPPPPTRPHSPVSDASSIHSDLSDVSSIHSNEGDASSIHVYDDAVSVHLREGDDVSIHVYDDGISVHLYEGDDASVRSDLSDVSSIHSNEDDASSIHSHEGGPSHEPVGDDTAEGPREAHHDAGEIKWLQSFDSGSTKPWKVEMPDGRVMVLKRGNVSDQEHIRTEVLTQKLYEAAGIPSLPAEIIRLTENGKEYPAQLTEFVPHFEVPSVEDLRASQDFRRHAGTDMVFGNWDLFKNDNWMNVGGRMVRADLGGALDRRAQGTLKEPGEFLNTDAVEEFNSMRQKGEKNNPYKLLTDKEIADSVRTLAHNLPPEKVAEVVRASGVEQEHAQQLTDALNKRIKAASEWADQVHPIETHRRKAPLDQQPPRPVSPPHEGQDDYVLKQLGEFGYDTDRIPNPESMTAEERRMVFGSDPGFLPPKYEKSTNPTEKPPMVGPEELLRKDQYGGGLRERVTSGVGRLQSGNLVRRMSPGEKEAFVKAIESQDVNEVVKQIFGAGNRGEVVFSVNEPFVFDREKAQGHLDGDDKYGWIMEIPITDGMLTFLQDHSYVSNPAEGAKPGAFLGNPNVKFEGMAGNDPKGDGIPNIVLKPQGFQHFWDSVDALQFVKAEDHSWNSRVKEDPEARKQREIDAQKAQGQARADAREAARAERKEQSEEEDMGLDLFG